MRTDLEAHDDDDRLDTADAEASENAAIEEVSEAPDDEQADDRFGSSGRGEVLVLLPSPLPPMLLVVCVWVVKSGEFSGSHSSGSLRAGAEMERVNFGSAAGRMECINDLHVGRTPTDQVLNASGRRDATHRRLAHEHDGALVAARRLLGADESMLQHLHYAVVEEIEHAGCVWDTINRLD